MKKKDRDDPVGTFLLFLSMVAFCLIVLFTAWKTDPF